MYNYCNITGLNTLWCPPQPADPEPWAQQHHGPQWGAATATSHIMDMIPDAGPVKRKTVMPDAD